MHNPMPENKLIERMIKRIRDPELARSMGTFGAFEVFPITTTETIREAELHLGFTLPALLRELYLKVGNGGFGPGYGLFGLPNGAPAIHSDGKYYDLVSFYHLYRGEQPAQPLKHDFQTQGSLFLETLDAWFDQLVPICAWGCHQYSLLDCSQAEAPVIHYIGPGGELILESPSFAGWIMDWLNGVDLWARVNND